MARDKQGPELAAQLLIYPVITSTLNDEVYAQSADQYFMTKDLDLVALVKEGHFISAKKLPDPLLQAIKNVGIAHHLNEDWINSTPSDLFEMGLPAGFKTRTSIFQYGGLIIHLAGRLDQICFKLYASVDQGPNSKHFADLQTLSPTNSELEIAKAWCLTHDVSNTFHDHILSAIAMFEEKRDKYS